MENSKPILLIVDDEEGPKASVKIIFQDAYQVLQASNGESALQLVRENSIDVAILDIMMAGMSGTELLGKIKEFDPAIEVVMLTAYETLQSARQSLRYDAFDYLNKPFDVSTIREVVGKAYGKRRNTIVRQSAFAELERLRQEFQDQSLKEQMARAKGEIYAHILHDINNPLTVISFYIDSIVQSLSGAESLQGEHLHAVRQEMDAVTAQSRRCFEISKRYLGYLHSREGEKHDASVNQTLEDIRVLLKKHPSMKDNTLQVDFLPGDARAAVHSIDLLQILLNLTANALQSTGEIHRVRIGARFPAGDPGPDALKQDANSRFSAGTDLSALSPMIAIQVEDDGPGIDARTLEKIFDTPVTTKAAGEGTGLGLTIVKRLVHSAGGGVHVRTGTNGTNFTVYLPAKR